MRQRAVHDPWNVAPGTYELRLFSNDTFTLLATSNTFTVTAPTLTVNKVGVLQGGTVTGTWAVGAPSTGDWMGLFAVGAPDTSYLVFKYTGGAATGSLVITIPTTVANGWYELRLMINNSYTRFATSSSFYVGPRTVSGTVTTGGAPMSGVAMAATNGVTCSTTNASGQYSCSALNGWSGTVTPSYTGYAFTPASRSYTSLASDQAAQDYTGGVVWQITGTILRNGAALPGVALAATNGGTCGATNASGQYGCTVPAGWSGTVTPSLASHVFTPASRSYSAVGAGQPAQDYTAVALRQLSGTVTSNGAPLAGVAFAATNGVSCSTSDASGHYACTVEQGWSGTVAPSLAGYNFGPGSRTYPSVMGDETAQDYVGTTAVASSRIYFVHVDHLNTPRAVSDASGTPVWRWDQAEPFGDSVPNDDPGNTGSHFDFPLRLSNYYAETGALYAMLRDCYDPVLGRFCESDPIGLRGGLNPYAYVNGDPLRFVDPLGLVRWTGGIISGGAFDWLGGLVLHFDLTSECKCGRRVSVKGFASGVGAGWALIDPSVNATNVEFEDYRTCPDPTSFNGVFSMISGGVVAYGGAAMTLGRAASIHHGVAIGNEIGASAVVGASAIRPSTVQVSTESCSPCPNSK